MTIFRCPAVPDSERILKERAQEGKTVKMTIEEPTELFETFYKSNAYDHIR